MRRLAAALAVVASLAAAAAADVPKPTGFVNDFAQVLPPATAARLTALIEELRAKTGAEIAVVTVDTTAPLDDFTYAMQLADAWKPGRKREDTGVVFLVAVKDRKLRILVGYGLEGILPDGLVGEISDRDVVPYFRAGRMDDGIAHGVEALASRIAADRGVTLTGVPPPAPRPAPPSGFPWQIILALVILLVIAAVLSRARPRAFRGRRGFPYGGWGGFGGGGFGSGGFGGGGFSGGGGGFGGFGGGGFGGGGAGRSW